jgi:hypothetical protein
MAILRPILETPRPVPSRRWPAAMGTFLILLALPVFVVAEWPLAGWALAAVLWLAGEAFAFALGRLPIGLDHLASSGFVGVIMTFRVIAVMVVLLAVTVADKPVGVAAGLLYIAAYTLQLALSLTFYFSGEARR